METGIHELTAGYALDALTEDERRAYEAHLDACPSCREELSGFQDVTAALAVAASGPEPPASLRDRILGDVAAERKAVVPIASRRRSWTPYLGAAAAVAAVAAVALGIWSISLAGELDSTRDALDRQEQAAAVLADPTARSVSITGAEGRLVVTDAGEAALVLDGLADAPGGKTYQLWVIEGSNAPIPAGLFDGAANGSSVPVDERVPTGAVVAVTVEAEGGVPAPTGDPVVASQPV